MTENLHQKFTTLEGLLDTNHTAVINALDSILTAFGAPPPGPTTTLVDVVTALTQTNTLLAGIRSDQSDQATAALSVLNSIDLDLATIIENNSTNTQKLLAAMYATFCGCSTGATLLPPIISVTPTPLAPDVKCQRIQYYIALFTSWLSKIANYTAATGGITSDVLGTLLALSATEAGLVATGAEVGSALGPPGVIVGAIVSLISGAVYLLGSAFLNDYIVDFNAPTFQHALLEALYAANSADEGQAAFESALTPFFSTVPAAILAALWWTAWSNDMYSDTPVVDASAFDSTICAPPVDTGCITVHVPGDTGTGDEGHGYGRITIADLTFFARITDETTITPSVDVFVQVNPFAGTNVLAGVETVLNSLPYHTHIDKLTPGLEFTVEFCHLGPE